MADSDARPTLCLTASFPPDGRFAPTAGELASRLAMSAGMAEDDANALGRSAAEAFNKALDGQSVETAPAIDVSLCAGETTLDLSVSCGSIPFLAINVPRPQ